MVDGESQKRHVTPKRVINLVIHDDKEKDKGNKNFTGLNQYNAAVIKRV